LGRIYSVISSANLLGVVDVMMPWSLSFF
jgi:hypothetical protein